ncbi:MAG: DUF1287 domain-containing protein [Rhodobacterales bacterium]|nr:MAG: DUF1287 domain-containing protein [Rhodobacterales bacterium]
MVNLLQHFSQSRRLSWSYPAALLLGLSLAGAAAGSGLAPAQSLRPLNRPAPTHGAEQPDSAWASKLIANARSQIGVTLIYDGRYQKLDFPNGDIDRLRGVCTDVVIRALRDAHGVDLQSEVNRDMKAHFAAYPKKWGLKTTDRNIDHRRVPNLRTYFRRQGAELPISDRASDYKPGDLVTWRLTGNLPHIGIVSDRMNTDHSRPLIIHNVGYGTQEVDVLFAYDITGHYRLQPGK